MQTFFLIGRYHFNVPPDLQGLRRQFPALTISYHTAHGVKGMTCDEAILLDLNSGVLGFPSEMADDPLLNNLLHEGESFDNAEERRVFYVAITRAKNRNHLIYDPNQPSKFIAEFQKNSIEEKGQTHPKCPNCGGSMIKRLGPFNQFFGCTHYPRCDGMLRIRDSQSSAAGLRD